VPPRGVTSNKKIQFLHWICFNASFQCRIHQCRDDMLHHERSFLHGMGVMICCARRMR
jgi:hypothetical protein